MPQSRLPELQDRIRGNSYATLPAPIEKSPEYSPDDGMGVYCEKLWERCGGKQRGSVPDSSNGCSSPGFCATAQPKTTAKIVHFMSETLRGEARDREEIEKRGMEEIE
jgi:hypothetical protein